MSDKSRDEIWDEWRDLVNMAPKEIEDFLETDESKSVGDDKGTGRKSAAKIVEIKRTDKDDLTDDQWDWMGQGGGLYQPPLRAGAGYAGGIGLGVQP